MSRTIALARTDSSGRAGTVRVTVLVGPDAGLDASVELPCIIGRSATAGVRLADPTASAMHVELSAEGDGIRIRDLESSNGTLVGSTWLRDGVLPSGSEIQVGNSVLRIHVGGLEVARAEIEEFGKLRSSSPLMRAVFALLPPTIRPLDP